MNYILMQESVQGHGVKRPDFERMINDVKNGTINLICVYKLDRFTRNIQDLESVVAMLEQYNCGLESAVEEINTTTANGKFFIRMLTVLSQLEIERTKVGVIGAIKKGHLTTTPFGYKKDGKKVIINEEQAAIGKEIFRLYLEGKFGCLIAQMMNQEYGHIKNFKTAL